MKSNRNICVRIMRKKKSLYAEKAKHISAILLLLMACSVSALAGIKGKVTDKKGEPITGVNIIWLNTTRGTVTDIKGEFEIERTAESNKLVFSNVAYNPDTVLIAPDQNHLNIQMDEQLALSEVSVVGRTPGTVKSRISVLQTENINSAELCKAACCNLSESFETNPSVDVSYSDAATGAKQIRLLGLPGTYVQMLTENIPNLRGISSAYGLDYIPGPWMESIQVSKGTSSVINGYEAIAGQINVEYKKPQTSDKVGVNVFASDAGRYEANVNASAILSPKLSTGVLLHASDELIELDQNNDGFTDMPMTRQYNFINRWYYKDKNYVSQAFVRALYENRMGGQISGNYHIGIETKRYEFFLKNGYIFNPETGNSVGLIISGSTHQQDAHYGTKQYNGHQGNLYANLIYQTNIGEHHKLSTGASFNFDNYDETLTVGSAILFPRKEFVPGVFAEYTWNLNDKLIALGGIRADHNSLYGTFVTPRLHLKYNVNEHLNLRANVGKGYRSPNILAENNFLLASNRSMNIANDLKMESAWNYGVSAQSFLHLFDKELSITGEWYYTSFDDQVVVDMDTDPHAVSFYNLNGKSYSSSAQIEANMEIFRGFTLTGAYRINDVKTTINGQLREKPLTNRSKGLITASYQTPLKKWQFDFTTQFNGSGRLPDPDAAQPLWDAEFKPFTIMNAQITKYFRTWSVYLGSENLTGFRQQNPVIDVQNPFGNNFDATMVWGPVHGQKIYIGFRWALERDI